MNVCIITDMQFDFILGALKNEAAHAIVKKMARYIRDFDGVIIFTHDTHYPNYLETQEGKNLPIPHTIIGTRGHEIIDELLEAVSGKPNVIHINKPTFGYLDWKNVIPADVTHIYICGTCTDICVISNALIIKAMFPEVPMTCFEDLCAGVTPELHKAAIDVMRSCQVEIVEEAPLKA